MIPAQCSKCHKELEKPGALLFSPPMSPLSDFYAESDSDDITAKMHLCIDCYELVRVFVVGDNDL